MKKKLLTIIILFATVILIGGIVLILHQNMTKKKLLTIIILFATVILIGGIALISHQNMANKNNSPNQYTAEQMFESTFDFALPSSAKVEKYTYYSSTNYEDYWCMKVKLNQNDYTIVKDELQKYFNKFGSVPIKIMPNIRNTCSWWDMDNSKIVNSYYAMKSGKFAMTLYLYAFLTNSKSNEYYLYISQ